MEKKFSGPWQRLSENQVYDNAWIGVSHHEVKTPGGSDGIYGVVKFKNKAVGVIPLDEQNNTWLVRQYRYPLEQPSWEIPEGGSPLGSDPLLCAQRELKEETGLVAQQWRQLMRLHTSNSVTDEEAFVFVASQLRQETAQLEDSEADMEVKKLSLVEAVEMALDGRITDAISVAGLLRLALELKL